MTHTDTHPAFTTRLEKLHRKRKAIFEYHQTKLALEELDRELAHTTDERICSIRVKQWHKLHSDLIAYTNQAPGIG